MKALVEGMPGSGECQNYVFTAMRGSSAYPMFKKEAADSVAAAERAEEKMRGELEKTWWNGVPEADKVRGVGERRGVRKTEDGGVLYGVGRRERGAVGMGWDGLV